jgi:RNA polymerase primary sigma factor
MTCNEIKSRDVLGSLDVYLREINTVSLLSAAEECTLATAIARGDKDARSRMIQANLRLVVSIARGFKGRGLPLDDLIAEGNVGLIRASTEFQARFGTRFANYASYWIKQSIRHALVNTTSMIRLPAHMVQLLTKWRRAERELFREWGKLPSFDEVASFLGLSDLRKALMANALQTHNVQPKGDDKLERATTCREDLWNCVESSLLADDERRMLSQRMKRLEKRERSILVLHYGLDGEAPMTFKVIGIRLDLTKEWVRRIHIRAICKLSTNQVDSAEQAGESSEAFQNHLRQMVNARC